MLEDRYGRRFHYLRLSITDVCNFRCQYCLPNGYQCDSARDFLNLQEIRILSHGFAELGTSKIRITGGEPSLRKDLTDIIGICANTPGIEQVAITTNGFQLDKHLPGWLAAGLTRLNVSIDSLDPRLFSSITGHDKLQTILRGIDIGLQAGLRIKVNSVLMNGVNDNELQRFLVWLKETPVTIRFIELMQTGDNLQFFKRHHLSGQPIKQQLLADGWQPVLKSQHDGPAEEFYHPDYAGRIGLIMPYSKDFCTSCNRLRISALGKLHLCLFAEQGLDLRRWLKTGDKEGLKAELQRLLVDKDASHWLQQGYTGATKQLAMLGG